jgi:hypothetical protein
VNLEKEGSPPHLTSSSRGEERVGVYIERKIICDFYAHPFPRGERRKWWDNFLIITNHFL